MFGPGLDCEIEAGAISTRLATADNLSKHEILKVKMLHWMLPSPYALLIAPESREIQPSLLELKHQGSAS